MDKVFTYSDVSEHNTKKDLYIVVHDKVYNASSFVDEHPGGEEVLLDVGGQDSTEAFEDVGHSDEAREILEGLYVGKLERKLDVANPQANGSSAKHMGPRSPIAERRHPQFPAETLMREYLGALPKETSEGDPKPKSYPAVGDTATATDGASTGVGLYAIILLGGALAFAAYTFMNKQSAE
ncbi:hypothetical protein GGP41_006894 [Bipolaris sorokiniana]|uniref:Cytochrome b5 heme-binding domain-containing protein n=1 Tax=Cochliobolus sativus TaxID=45130 RepID=A0A8H5ZRM2_COCSA|nr:hypothetical protein GGP41_006894 [Bipolaris sorokiniana]